MRDLIREGLKLGELLARLPWQAARRMTGARSETVRAAADLGERLGTLPFRVARRVLTPQKAGGGAPAPRCRILVLGAGYAGLTCHLELQEHVPAGVEVVLVNGDRYHWFTTELHTYVAGESEDAVRIPLSRVVARPGRLLLGRVEQIDLAAREVGLTGGVRLHYDFLVFALGSDPEYYNLPGVPEHSLMVGNWQGAVRVRERVKALLRPTGEQPLGVVVAGGGLTGVEVAGELADEYPQRVRLTIIEAGPQIMAGFAPELVAVSQEILEAKGVTIRTGNAITRVEPGQVHFKDGQVQEFDLLVWAGGVRGTRILTDSGFAVTPRGRAKVDAYLRAEGHPEVYVVGDSAAFTDPATGRELPPTAQAAVQMGRAAARSLLQHLRGRAEAPFQPIIRGAFASLGRGEGVGQIGAEQYRGIPAVVVKQLIEAQHAWDTGVGVLPLVQRILRAPGRMLGGRTVRRDLRSPGMPLTVTGIADTQPVPPRQ